MTGPDLEASGMPDPPWTILKGLKTYLFDRSHVQEKKLHTPKRKVRVNEQGEQEYIHGNDNLGGPPQAKLQQPQDKMPQHCLYLHSALARAGS